MRFSSTIFAAFLGGLIVPGTAFSERRLERNHLGKKADGSCLGEQPPSIAPHKNFWGGLTKEETRDVLALLHSDSVGFNLTEANDAGRYDSSTHWMLSNQPH
jgi:primary-amine oxidase